MKRHHSILILSLSLILSFTHAQQNPAQGQRLPASQNQFLGNAQQGTLGQPQTACQQGVLPGQAEQVRAQQFLRGQVPGQFQQGVLPGQNAYNGFQQGVLPGQAEQVRGQQFLRGQVPGQFQHGPGGYSCFNADFGLPQIFGYPFYSDRRFFFNPDPLLYDAVRKQYRGPGQVFIPNPNLNYRGFVLSN